MFIYKVKECQHGPFPINKLIKQIYFLLRLFFTVSSNGGLFKS